MQIPETEGASLAASHSVGFCEVSVADNSPNLYKVFEKLLVESRARPVKPRKFSVSKMIGELLNWRVELKKKLIICVLSAASIRNANWKQRYASALNQPGNGAGLQQRRTAKDSLDKASTSVHGRRLTMTGELCQ